MPPIYKIKYNAEEVLGKDLDLILTQDCAPNHHKITDNLAFMLGGNIFVGKNKYTFFGQFEMGILSW